MLIGIHVSEWTSRKYCVSHNQKSAAAGSNPPQIRNHLVLAALILPVVSGTLLISHAVPWSFVGIVVTILASAGLVAINAPSTW